MVLALAVAAVCAYPEGHFAEISGHEYGGHEGLQAVDFSGYSHGGGSDHGHHQEEEEQEEHIDYYVSFQLQQQSLKINEKFRLIPNIPSNMA